MKQFMENLLENRSTNEAFDFYVTCESCGEEYGNTVVRFSKAGMFPVTQSEKILWNALYEQEMRIARQTATVSFSIDESEFTYHYKYRCQITDSSGKVIYSDEVWVVEG